jgi:hypothetical protein
MCPVQTTEPKLHHLKNRAEIFTCSSKKISENQENSCYVGTAPNTPELTENRDITAVTGNSPSTAQGYSSRGLDLNPAAATD